MKKAFLLCGLLTFLAVPLEAQLSIPFRNAIWRSATATVEGSPYLEDSWKLGTVTDSRDEKVYRVFLKYDTELDRIIVNSNGRAAMLDDQRYAQFTLGFKDEAMSSIDRSFVNASQLNIPGLAGYYEILHEGRFLLLQKVYTDFIPNTIPEYGTNRKVLLYLTREDLYLVDIARECSKVPNRPRNIFPLFDEHESMARAIAQKEELYIDKVQDFVTLLTLIEKEIVLN